MMMKWFFIHATHDSADWVIHLSVDGETYEVTVTRGRKAVIKVIDWIGLH